MKRLGLLVLAAGIAILLSTPAFAAGPASRSLSLAVYADGYVHVHQAFSVDPKATSVQIPLLSAAVSDLVATDQEGSPLSYGFAPGGGNVTVYTLGASAVTLSYDTGSLTSKNGTIWTLSFGTGYNSTVILPPLSTLTSASGTPYSVNETGTSPELSLPPGSWVVDYGVPFVGSATTTSGPTTQPGLPGNNQYELAVEAGAAGALAVAVLAFWRLRSRIPNQGELRPDDVQVLNFIREKGGKVLEPEIRTRFALPKTSAWRQIKRLERMGYVKVTKVGSLNQIEALKERRTEG
ncbi:MAG: hypothetical protein KGI26_02080 [Thaumarchaeota archaeon]|nr:hypothetical protein [Nitrososphaerota archaeon]